MLRMVQDIRGAAPLRMVLGNFARAGIAMVFASCIAVTAAAQQTPADDTEIAPASQAPPLRITQHYTPAAPQPRGALTLLVDAPPGPGAPAQQTASQETAPPVPIGDRLEGPAINTLAQGRSAITVSTLTARRR